MKTEHGDEIVYVLIVEDIQEGAKKQIGRELNEEELRMTKQCVESELGMAFDAALSSAIDLATTITETVKG